MDTDNKTAHSRRRFSHEAARRTLTEKYQARMIFAHAGGMWQAGPELINILTANLTHGQQGMFLLDLYGIPTAVDFKELLEIALEKWQKEMAEWFREYQNINQQR